MDDELGFAKEEKGTPRRFGLLMAAVLLLLSGWAAYRTSFIAWGLLPAGLLLGGGAIFAPAALEPLERRWMWFAERVAKVGNTVVLTAFFFLILTPFGLVLRLIRRDRLQLRSRSVSTYWIPVVPNERSTYHDPF